MCRPGSVSYSEEACVYLPDTAPIINELQQILETGSRWECGGLDPKRGAGCYGLAYWAFRRVGIALPVTAEEAEHVFIRVCEPYCAWDIVLVQWAPWQMERHLGLLMAPSWGYHIAQSSNGLARFALSHPLWRRGLRHVWRYRVFATLTEGVCT